MDDPDESLRYMIHHVFLPPRLPKNGDGKRFAVTDRVLLQRVQEALGSFDEFSAAGRDENIMAVRSMIERLIAVTTDEGHISENLLLEALAELSTTGGAIPLYIRAQNAAIILRKEGGNIIFEAFELTPPNRAIVTTRGRLKRCFPGLAVAVPIATFNDSGFRSTVCNTLAKMSHQEATEMKSTTRKAGQHHTENRDTTNPQLITEFLMSYLEAVGSPVSVPKIWKNTREEVMWSSGLLPWHRSPVWLLIRVAMQTTFSRLDTSRDYYKEFMVFCMAKVTAQAISLDIPSDILHCLTSRISKRLSKLGPKIGQAWLASVESTLRGATEHLHAVWKRVIASDRDLQTEVLSTLDFKKDSVLQFPVLDEYIQFVEQSPSSDSLPDAFSPPHLTTTFPSDTLPVISTSSADVIDYALAAFEEWVSSNLSGWLESHVLNPGTCGDLGQSLQKYYALASSQYKANPEAISIMLLTCLELWIACDKSATRQHPLMLCYNPEVPVPLLQSLILPLKLQLERLSRIEDYLGRRTNQAKYDSSLIFSKFGHQNSFAVRYFATSKVHQDLRANIEKWAHKNRELKKSELCREKKEYNRLMNLYATSQCEEKDQWCPFIGKARSAHSPSCTRCAHKKTASNMRIAVDEWPLPQRRLEAQATVFELKCPQAFNDWRDATLLLNMDVLKSDNSSYARPEWRNQAVSGATESSICVNNGLTYQYLDDDRGCFTNTVDKTEKIPQMCTYQLQHYKALQQFVYRPHLKPDGPQHNVLISQQHACPSDMSLEEFKALGTIPLGVRLQWRNILQQLSLPSIDFKKLVTSLVLFQVARGWTLKLRDMASETTDQDQRDELLRRAFNIALTCTSTFDVEHRHLNDELRQPSQSAIFVECSIIIHETSHAAIVPGDVVQRISVQRWRKLSHRALPLLLSEIAERNSAFIDIAIGKRWLGYRPGQGWHSRSGKAQHWVSATTSSHSDAASQIVQYSLLSGELRVDGLPLSRLPSPFEQHAMYKVLFDRSTIEVMRTHLRGMEFSAMNAFRGYNVSFAMRKFQGGSSPSSGGLDLMLTSVKGDESYSLLPSRIFAGKLPDHFVKKYVHWYHIDNHTVEFRPIGDPWTSSEDHWTLSKDNSGWSMTEGKNKEAFLAGMTSQTGEMICGLLRSIESSDHIHLIFRPSHAHVGIELPRLKLNFVLAQNSGLLKSRQFRGMYVDSNQRIETLVGLQSKVVLRNDKEDRIVLIPDGTVSWKAAPDHIRVEVPYGSSSKVYPFELDRQLGRIIDNGMLESKLALCYLHALTAFCLPDGLTGKTGTEQALEILNSAAVKSFDHFSEQNINLLYAIAELTPRRVHYPAHLREMQDVDWVHDLSPLSQHGRLYTDVFSVMMFLATLAYAQSVDFAVIDVLVALFNVPEFGQAKIPDTMQPYFELESGRDLQSSRLTTTLESAAKQFIKCPEYRYPALPTESSNDTWDRRTREWKSKKQDVISSIVEDFRGQWPCETLRKPTIPDMDTYVDMNAALASTTSYVKTWWDNHRFYRYLRRIGKAFEVQPVHQLPGSTFSMSLPPPGPAKGRAWLTDGDLLALQAPPVLTTIPSLPPDLTRSVGADATVTKRLMDMIARLKDQAKLRHEKEYVEDLQKSSKGLQAQSSQAILTDEDEDIQVLLRDNVHRCQDYVTRLYTALVDGLKYTTHLPLGGLAAKYNSPRVTPAFFLKQLSRKRWAGLSPSWREAIVAYGMAITTLQRSVRLLGLCDSRADLVKELLNPGHENWSPHDSPESLLIEIESGILVRKVQAEIAEQMKHPAGNNNAVMQLNMGEGKSSVIVPIVAVSLADGSRLVRVVVAKPQSKQMFQMLASKVGGLCDRQIYHMPFSRSLKLGQAEVDTIAKTYRECMETGGILLVQPEHLLSFQLMGIETNLASDNKAAVSRSLLSTQHFFGTHSRDIVDESDENFSVKFELVYTMGTQRPIDLSPGRWYMVQTVLRLVRKHVPVVQQELPLSVELERGPGGSFSRTRLLREDAQQRLCHRLSAEICATGLPEFPIARQSQTLRDAVFKYITEPELSPEDVSFVEGSIKFWTDAIKQPLLLLRGLIAGGVLAFALGQKRWRVNYGLTPTRRPETRLAVPYRAKDSPALRSEFSHPDVVIVLTCLSYYYGGLGDEDLFTAFEHLIKSDQADTEYDEWVRDAPKLPLSFRSLSGINLKDRYQCTRDIFPHLRQAQAVVDFFLARIVFPREMKEFPHKLSASGWDLGRTKPNPTTGFSGTNDSKHLLSLTVHHLDLDEQRHTNALVLLHLLQPENSVEIMPPSSGTQCADAVRLLHLVVDLDQPAQVILDVGAQVIELSNIQVAQEWLKMTASGSVKQAVVFFDDGDNLMVCDRAGHIEAFQTSPYSKQLDLCYVFLDEAHTRGTDLKLPQDYRAVVTLGAGLTKDRLVQACMRMRKLGKGQSVVFCIPEEIRMKILGVTGKSETVDIDVSDVLMWSINETYADLRRSMPLWAAQGTRFERQWQIWDNATSADGIKLSVEEAEKFLEQEALTLEDRYRPRDETAEADALFQGSESNPRFSEIRSRCERFDSTKFTAAALQEEQERELSPEIEAERQVERPKPASPKPMHVHEHVRTFVRTGTILHVDPAFKPAFRALDKISAAAEYDVGQFPRDLLVTADFARTVELKGKGVQSDAYQRPVQWILTTRLTSSGPNRMVVISPFEANALLPQIQKPSAAVHLHLYAPRSNLAFKPLDDLRLYTVPALPPNWSIPADLVLQLNLFAGQLYFRSYDEYKAACELLGLAWRLMDGDRTEPDGFIVRDPWDADRRFRKSPTKFLQVLMATIRRDGRGIGKTHWGRVLTGEILGRGEFEDAGEELTGEQ
ncbi:Phosphate system positive regulatory protein PHO81 [Coniochaeta hoffmannii]|uniref:ubiquitinyl hydrolase 1 n=1 Tax=Coniochaeta hoffmannii TaxID=91930 RepID=A0AA38RA87_9PEZI|nr:Phosphate system positive regulatory protein PHO81 [Coniochaeta hoffmannii]